ncbi:ATP-binding cassette domain-containing protein [Nocardiopsis coralliicola]
MRRATGAIVHADELELRTGEGTVFTGVSFTAMPGTLTVFEGDAGSGRTALLLTLGGRMRPSSGALRVDGHVLPRHARKVRRIAAPALLSGVNDLDERLRVREHLAERMLLRFRPAPEGVVAPALSAAGLSDLDRTRLVRDLSAVERARLGVALALLEEPRLLLADGVGAGLGAGHRAAMWALLHELAEGGLTAIATCADASGSGADVHPLRPVPDAAGGAGTEAASAGAARGRLRLADLFSGRARGRAAGTGEGGGAEVAGTGAPAGPFSDAGGSSPSSGGAAGDGTAVSGSGSGALGGGPDGAPAGAEDRPPGAPGGPEGTAEAEEG